ncbi:MAG TPA: hypothetical protein HA298_04110 [Methanobacteriales archaeon]|nr:hypothetical protein [Methanobacteriales archaeon]
MKKELFVLFFALVFMVSMGAVSATNSTCEVGIRANYEYPEEINATIRELTDSSKQKNRIPKVLRSRSKHHQDNIPTLTTRNRIPNKNQSTRIPNNNTTVHTYNPAGINIKIAPQRMQLKVY